MTVTTSSDGSKVLVFLLLLLLVLLLIAMAGLGGMAGKVEYGSHAVERHGQDAIRARSINERNGQRYDCQDGKSYWIGRAEDGKYAITVVRGGQEATSFLTRSRNYIRNILKKDDCFPSPSW